MGLTTEIISTAINPIGKHKIPKYLYHITPTKNVGNIRRTGLEMSEDDLFGEGVFLFDIANFVKFWMKQRKEGNYAKMLFKYIGRRSTDVTMLKIPTQNIAKDKLVIRRQDKLFQVSYKYKELNDIYNAYGRKEISPLLMDEISIGTPAVQTNRFDRKKIPVEYIYPAEISAKYIQILGHAKYDYLSFDIKNILDNLLKNCKESEFLSKFL